MNRHPRQVQSRRALFVGVFRYATLGLLGAAGGWGFAKRRKLVAEGKCVSRGICRGCEVFEECGLPPRTNCPAVKDPNPAPELGRGEPAPGRQGHSAGSIGAGSAKQVLKNR